MSVVRVVPPSVQIRDSQQHEAVCIQSEQGRKSQTQRGEPVVVLVEIGDALVVLGIGDRTLRGERGTGLASGILAGETELVVETVEGASLGTGVGHC